jgi:hypothetical protein
VTETVARAGERSAKGRERKSKGTLADEVQAIADATPTTETTAQSAVSPPATTTEAVADIKTSDRGGLRLPVVGVRVPVPHVPLPSQHQVIVGALRVGDAVRDNLPKNDRLLYYGGLGALAAFGVVDWPVALVVGTGVWVASRRRGAAPSRAVDETRAPSQTKEPNSGS